jgi:hypothetical protein
MIPGNPARPVIESVIAAGDLAALCGAQPREGDSQIYICYPAVIPVHEVHDARQKIQYRMRNRPWKDAKDGQPFIERWFYYIGNNRGILSPKQFGKADPVDTLITSLFRSGKPEDRVLAKKLLAKMRVYAPVIVRGEEDKGVLVWSFGKIVYQYEAGVIFRLGRLEKTKAEREALYDAREFELYRDENVPLEARDTELRQKYQKIAGAMTVTYDGREQTLQQASRVADRVSFFLGGEVIEEGPADQIFTRPKDKRTEDYISGKFG